MSDWAVVGWLANAVLVAGLWQVGRRRWQAFVLTALGEAVWVAVAVRRREWDLAAICAVFGLLAVRNLILWRNAPHPLAAATREDLLAELDRRGAD